jgi:hypothetical protein
MGAAKVGAHGMDYTRFEAECNRVSEIILHGNQTSRVPMLALGRDSGHPEPTRYSYSALYIMSARTPVLGVSPLIVRG